MRRLSRRSLLRSVGVGAATMLVAACQPKVVEVTRVVEKEVEKVVKETVIVEGTPQIVEKVVTAAPATDPVTLVVETYQWQEAGFREWLEWVTQRMQDTYPNVEIEARSAPHGEYNDKLLVKLESGTLGDVFQGDVNKIPVWLPMGGLEALNNYMDVDPLRQAINPGVWSTIAPGDQLMGCLTLHTVDNVMIYNAKHFEEAGVTMPGLGEQDKWLDLSVELTQAPERYGFACFTLPEVGRSIEDLTHYVTMFGASYSREDGTPAFDTPEMLAALTFKRRIVESGATPIGTEKPTLRAMTWNGQISQWMDGSWFFGSAKASDATALEELKAAVPPFPQCRDDHTFNIYHLYGKSKIKETAAKWLEIAWSQDSALKFIEFTGSPHGCPVDLPAELANSQPWMPAYSEVLACEFVPDINPGFALVREEANQIINNNTYAATVSGDMTPEEACERTQAELLELSEKYGGETF